jgi:hypothetical protein
MTLRHRLDRLAAKAPISASEHPTEFVLLGVCPEIKEAISAHFMFGGQTIERMSDETEVEFMERINRCGQAR